MHLNTKTTLSALTALLLAACASTPNTVEAPAASISAPVAETKPAEPVVVKPVQPIFTAVQFEALDKELTAPIAHKFLRSLQEQARPMIREFLSTNACVINDDGTALQALAESDQSFPSSAYAAPMLSLSAHDKTQCLSIKDISGLMAPMGNSLRLNVEYLASNGETIKLRHDFRRQKNGEWRVVR